MAEKKKGVLDDLGLGSDKKSSDAKGSAKKKKSGGFDWKIALYVVGGALTLYITYRMYEDYEANSAANAANTAATTAATTPTSDGEIATGGATPGTESGDPFQVANSDDPTGETYAQELADLENQIGVDNTNFADIESYLPGGANYVSPTSPSTVPPDATTVTTETRAQLIADVQKATGLSAAQAGQQVALYLEGKPLTSKAAVDSIGNQVTAGLAPVTNGSSTLPTPTLAKSATTTSTAASSALATSEANLKTAEAAAAKDPTAANKAAVAAHESQVKAGR